MLAGILFADVIKNSISGNKSYYFCAVTDVQILHAEL